MISADDGTVEKLKQVIHTVTYSYSVAQEAAREVVKRDKYEDDDRVITLEFSPPWVYNFFKYYHFRHRRTGLGLPLSKGPLMALPYRLIAREKVRAAQPR